MDIGTTLSETNKYEFAMILAQHRQTDTQLNLPY